MLKLLFTPKGKVQGGTFSKYKKPTAAAFYILIEAFALENTNDPFCTFSQSTRDVLEAKYGSKRLMILNPPKAAFTGQVLDLNGVAIRNAAFAAFQLTRLNY